MQQRLLSMQNKVVQYRDALMQIPVLGPGMKLFTHTPRIPTTWCYATQNISTVMNNGILSTIHHAIFLISMSELRMMDWETLSFSYSPSIRSSQWGVHAAEYISVKTALSPSSACSPSLRSIRKRISNFLSPYNSHPNPICPSYWTECLKMLGLYSFLAT